MTEQAKLLYSPLGKVFEKQRKTIDDVDEKQRKMIKDAAEKQAKALHTLNKDQQLKSIGDLKWKAKKDELEEFKKIEQGINREII